MGAEEITSYFSDKTLLGSIEENHRYIKELLLIKANIMSQVQSAMDKRARTKTPLSERRQRVFSEFTSVYAKEGGQLRESLTKIEHIQNLIHTEKNTLDFMLSVSLLKKHQNNAIKNLRLMISSSENVLTAIL